MPKVSCLIATYNEEKQIESILSTLNLLLGEQLKEIIVIDDFSSDRTTQIVRKFSHIVLIEHTKNEGKSKAIADGIAKAKSDYILMLDGDLIGFEKNNVLDLINPIVNNKADISISYRGNTVKWWISLFKIETFSGERCFPKAFLLKNLELVENLSGYGLEVYINQEAIKNKLRIKSVPMNNVRIEFKWHKHGILLGIWKEILMWQQIFTVVSPFKLAIQVLEMQKLLVP